MTNPKTTNAAARLHKFFKAALNLSGAATHQQLAIAFEMDPKTTTLDLLRTSIQAAEAIDEIEVRTKKIPGVNHELFLRHLVHLKSGLQAATQNSDFNHWKANYLRPEHIQPLEYCADLLSRHYPEDEIPPDELLKILKQDDEVYESVMASGLNADLKATILELLEKVKRAVHDYRIKGVYALTDVLDSATGKLFLHRDEVQQAEGHPEQKKEVAKFYRLLEYLDKITAVASRSAPLFTRLLSNPQLLLVGAEVADKLKHH